MPSSRSAACPYGFGRDDASFIARLMRTLCRLCKCFEPTPASILKLNWPRRAPNPATRICSVAWDSGRWLMERGDFRAEWNPSTARGRIQQTINPYSLDSVLRIVHTLLLAREGGFLVHASSAIRNGRAFLFAGVSGAGKTTIARLAPPDAALLTDEISYVTRQDDRYVAVGTPFFGELARVGENLHAPIECVVPARQRPGKQNRACRRKPTPSADCSEIFFFLRGILNL